MVNFKILLSFLIISFCSCTSAIKNDNVSASDEVLTTSNSNKPEPIKAPGNTNLIIKDEADIPGFWVGMFEPDTNVEAVSAGEFYWNRSIKISICIDKVEQGKVTGYSIVSGIKRPFNGELILADNIYSFHLKEPGDDKHDGVFYCSIKNDNVLKGNWQSFKQLKIGRRTFELGKQIFEYKPELQLEKSGERYIDWNKSKGMKYKNEVDDYDISYFTTTNDVYKYNASMKLLTSAQVSNMTKGDLFILRNTIYARHGYSFKSSQLHAFFDQQNWYMPVATNVKDYLTETEKANITLLLRYEKNAKEYYDVFGRG